MSVPAVLLYFTEALQSHSSAASYALSTEKIILAATQQIKPKREKLK